MKAFLVSLLLIACFPTFSLSDETQLRVPCEVIEVYDGDTVTVRLTVDVRIRLIDCWAPEIRTKDALEKQYGQHARLTLAELLHGERTHLIVPLSGADRLDDVLTLGRVLGRIWIADSQLDASDEMVRMGVAMGVKP